MYATNDRGALRVSAREAAAPDIDLVPVLVEVNDFHGMDPARYAGIETVSWNNPNARQEGAFKGGSVRLTGNRRIWNTNLDRGCYDAALDRNDYR